MTPEQQKVLEFHEKFDHYRHPYPQIVPEPVAIFRYALIREELEELKTAMMDYDLIEVADALGDLLYVVYGTAVSYGIDMQPIFDEIHRTNMLKTFDKNKAGKSLKGPDWKPPQIEKILKTLYPSS